MTKEDNLYLENLDEFINDENRIVTYKWLSRTLHVHCNIAKQMLYKFIQEERKKKPNAGLTVTYFVSGLAKPDENGVQAMKCSVVPEAKLEAFKQSLALLISCHVYSVQKGKLKDSNALYMTDYEKFKENVFESNKYSSIQCDRAVLRSQEELDLPSLNSLPPSEPDKKAANGVSTSAKPAGKKQPQSAIASMFSKAETAKKTAKEPETKTKDPPSETESKAPAKGGKPKQGPMANFFSKQTDKKTEPSSKPALKQDTAKPVDKKPPLEMKESPTGQSKKTARKHDSDDEEIENKSKRRRIKPDLFDSSSEEEDMEDEDDNPIPPTPPPTKEPSPEPVEPEKEVSPEVEVVKAEEPKKTSPAKESVEKGSKSGERRRKRIRKQVQKTYMGSDGYMVTEKVWESDSTDASEAEEPVKKAAREPPRPAAQTKGRKSPQKKQSPGKKGGATGKQTSLTSFFKKS